MFCIHTDGAGFQVWFETIEEAKRHALYTICITDGLDRLYISDEYDYLGYVDRWGYADRWGSVDRDGCPIHESIF